MAVHAGTGQYFELKQNVFRDDRRDVLASTRAALDYLQKLYGMFGDWHLALAAYNWGEGSVARAIARTSDMGLGTGYTDLNMPTETRSYVPKLQAVKNIVANPDALHAELPLIENHPYFQTVTITRDIDVDAGGPAGRCVAGGLQGAEPLDEAAGRAGGRHARRSCCPGTTPRSSSAISRPTTTASTRAGRPGARRPP